MYWFFLPAFNEEKALPILLDKISTAMNSHAIDFQVVVVNDGSTDNTPMILDELSQKLPLHVITHSINRGLGETERDGFEFISNQCKDEDFIIRLDCDDTHEPQYIFSMIEKLNQGYDVVNTSRFQPGGGQLGVPTFRKYISSAANLFMKIVFRIPGTRDYSCGFRAYRSPFIRDAIRIFGDKFIQLRGLGFTSTLEMIIKLHIMGARFAEVPFVLRYDQKKSASKMISSITTLGYLIMGLLYYWPFSGWKRQWKGLKKMYREDPRKAVESFDYRTFRRKNVSKISF